MGVSRHFMTITGEYLSETGGEGQPAEDGGEGQPAEDGGSPHTSSGGK